MEPSTSKLVTIQATAKTAGTILNVASVTAQDPANPSKVIEDGDAVNTFVFVSTCGAYNPNNEKYQCPQGTEFDDNALNATNPSTEVSTGQQQQRLQEASAGGGLLMVA